MLKPGLACLLAAISGLASLSWQAVWLPQLSVALGNEFVATLGMTAGVLAGLAVGALVFGRCAEQSSYPWLWFAGLEAMCGLWGLGATSWLPSVVPWIARLLGESPSAVAQGLVAMTAPSILLSPSTVAMGASVPALVAAIGEGRLNDTRLLPVLYASNTAGAVIGVAAAGVVLLPLLGTERVGLLTALLNLSCAAVATGLSFAQTNRNNRHEASKDSIKPAQRTPSSDASKPLLLLACIGILSIGFETVALRVLNEFHENTALNFSIVLGVFLSGSALGSAVFVQGRHASGPPAAALLACGGAVLFGTVALFTLPLWGGDYGLSGEFRRAAVVLMPAAVASGMALAACCAWAQTFGLTAATSLGVNTLAAAGAPAVVGLIGIPMIGTASTAVVVGLCYCCVAATALPLPVRRWGLLLGLPLMIGAAWAVPAMPGAQPSKGEFVRWRGEGLMATVTITEDAQSTLRLRINNRAQEGSSAFSPIEARLAALPLLMHPQPQSALFLGLGTGHTAYTAALDPMLEVDAVELINEVEQASRVFMGLEQAPRPSRAPRVVVADARRFALATSRHYDVIVADLYHPARSGSANLYTVEHYQALRDRLKPGGIVVQWLALHQMEVSTLGSIVAAFKTAFPDGMAMLAGNALETPVLGLIDRPNAEMMNLGQLALRLKTSGPSLMQMMDRADLRDSHAVLGSLWVGPSALADWSAGFQPNRDAWPVTGPMAIQDTYLPRSKPPERLGDLLKAFSEFAGSLPFTRLEAMDSADAQSLQAYWTARHRYLELGLSLTSGTVAPPSQQQLEHSLERIIAMSPEFKPAVRALGSLRQPRQP